ncbi:hypothetical protein HanIR_Chr06g0273621 [Helianthus annuus]|nr:hypothetical protein HanIR_Chr06g0273621 [Helianthus annuus]
MIPSYLQLRSPSGCYRQHSLTEKALSLLWLSYPTSTNLLVTYLLASHPQAHV